MRAIALDGSLTARLRKDETRYTLNEAAERFHEMGYRLARGDHGRLPSWHGDAAGVEAELQTACGCTKRMFIDRHTRTIRIPMLQGYSVKLNSDLSDTVSVNIRQFEFRRYEAGEDGIPLAIYVEVT